MKRILGIALLCGSLWQCQSKHGAKPSDPVHSQKGKGTETEIVAPLTPAEAAEQAAQASADFIANNCGTDTNTPGPCAAAEATQALANTPTDGGSNALVDAYTQLQTDPDVQTAVQDAGTNAAIDQAVASAEAGDTSTPAPGNSMAKNGVMFTGVGLLSLGFIAFAGGYGVQTAIEKGIITAEKAQQNRKQAVESWSKWAGEKRKVAVEFFTSLPGFFTSENLAKIKSAVAELPKSVAEGLMHAVYEARNLSLPERQAVWGRLKGIIGGIKGLSEADKLVVGDFLVTDRVGYWPQLETYSLLYKAESKIGALERQIMSLDRISQVNDAWESVKERSPDDAKIFRKMYQMDGNDKIIWDAAEDGGGYARRTPEYQKIVLEQDVELGLRGLAAKYDKLTPQGRAFVEGVLNVKAAKVTGGAVLKNVQGHMQAVKSVAQGTSSLHSKAKASKVAGIGAMIVGGVFAAAGGSMNLADGTDSNPASDYLTTMGNLYNGLVAQPQ